MGRRDRGIRRGILSLPFPERRQRSKDRKGARARTTLKRKSDAEQSALVRPNSDFDIIKTTTGLGQL
jgi:hypothetical protein